VIDPKSSRRRFPHVDDIDGQTKAVGGALASALLTATEMPLHMLQPVVGIWQPNWWPTASGRPSTSTRRRCTRRHWITDGIRQQSVKLPEQPAHTEAEPVVARTDEAPKCRSGSQGARAGGQAVTTPGGVPNLPRVR
jgi:hypothetical protein